MNILIHASLYPESEDSKRANTTLFIHSYAVEWVRAGHRVVVIHHKARYPRAMVAAGRTLGALPAFARLRGFLSGYGEDGDRTYRREGVTVIRMNYPKRVPHALVSEPMARKIAEAVDRRLVETGFAPDIVLCDFINPGLLIANHQRSDVPVCAVLHVTDEGYLSRARTKRRALDGLRRADAVGFRSEENARRFRERYFAPTCPLILSSGIPRELKKFMHTASPRTRVKRFLCVARFVRGKHIDRVIRAFGGLSDGEATLTIIGTGPEGPALRKLASDQPNAERIRFAGALTRAEVFERMAEADCFALISERETFGMVYIEAMRAGAIPIGSSGEGIGSIIRDGVNGFLIPSGDAEALRRAMERLDRLDPSEIADLSRNAMRDSEPYKDHVLAENAAREFERLIASHGLQDAGAKV